MNKFVETSLKPVVALALSIVVVSSLSGCREEEQGRVLQYKKGVYLGIADGATDPATRAMLRGRTWSQSGLSGGAVPHGVGAASGSSSGASFSN